MAKQKIPTSIQNKFNRQQFKVGDYVYINFLGEKLYGYVKKITERSGTFTYMVQTSTYSYPCGIQIDEYESGTAGNILFNDTKQIGSEEIKRRFDVGTIPRVITRSARPEPRQDTVKRTDVDITVSKVSPKRRKTKQPRTVDVQPSDNGNTQSNRTRRKSYSKLDEAIEKQKNFLRKFT